MIYQLPHPLDRPGQLETYQWLRASDKKYIIICAPTGSGKSAWPAELSKYFKIMVLTQTKSLQAENYKGIYGFDPLYGKSTYPCENENSPPLYTAFDCQANDCECPYQLQEKVILRSDRASLNYAKYLMSSGLIDMVKPDWLFLDEAHNLPDIVSGHIGLTLRWDNEFIRYRQPPKKTRQLSWHEAMSYFRQCYRLIVANKPRKKENLPKWRRWKRLSQRVEIVNSFIGYSPLVDWYYEANEKQLLIRPLTAKYHFTRLFNAPKVVLMSATIRPSMAERLGIPEDEVAFYELDNYWPTPSRLIYDLGGPAINYRSSEEDLLKQAKLIRGVLCDKKSGIIHTASKDQADDLKTRLIQSGWDGVWVPTRGEGTDKQLQAWYQARKPGLYCISWAFHEGVNLGDDDICIMAKTPWPSLGSPYEQAKQELDPAWYLEKGADRMEQLFGRLIREWPDGSKMQYIADSSWHRLKNCLSKDFKKRIRRM